MCLLFVGKTTICGRDLMLGKKSSLQKFLIHRHDMEKSTCHSGMCGSTYPGSVHISGLLDAEIS